MMTGVSMKYGRLLCPLVVALGLGGCAGMPQDEQGGAGSRAAAESPTPAPAAEAANTQSGGGARELAAILEMLQDGEYDEGRRALQAYLRDDSRSAMARGLLRELDANPVELLGAEHEPYTVRRGDTLGEIAGRHLGDPLSFVALARYNGISRPKALSAGQVLKLPVRKRLSPASAAAASAPAPANAPAARPVEQDPRLRAIEDDLAAGRTDAALAGIARLGVEGGVSADRVASLHKRARGQQHQQRGMVLLHAGRNEEAYAAFGQALREVPELEPANRHREELRKRLVSDYHEAAVVHYRNQRLDEAIALWDKALALDPSFEPAQGYRTRAQELRRRLKALED